MSFGGAASVVLFFYLFPDGRFVPRWTRWVALVWIVGAMIPNTFFPDRFLPVFGHPLAYAFLGATFAGTTLFAQVYRYRQVSSPVQRQQTKWVVFGLAMALGGASVVALFDLVVAQDVLASLVGTTSFYFFTLLIALSVEASSARPLIGSMRAMFVVPCVTVSVAGFQLFVLTEYTDRFFAWTVDVPLTAAFLDASFWGSFALAHYGCATVNWSGAGGWIYLLFVLSVFGVGLYGLLEAWRRIGRFST